MPCDSAGMAQDVCILVSTEDRARLAAIAGDRSGRHKHMLRARIVLFSAERLPVLEVARRAGVSRPAVWRWQRRFAEAGVDGLLREKPRILGKPPLPRATVERVVTLTCAAPPGEATHWSGRAMARAVGIGLSSVQRIWKAHGLQPHRIRTFKRSRDPAFAAKLRDIVGLYMDPPAHAIVLSIDEKSQIQALDRSQPGLPLKPGKCGTMTHDYKRHGTTTLFAALNVLDGTNRCCCVLARPARGRLVAGERLRHRLGCPPLGVRAGKPKKGPTHGEASRSLVAMVLLHPSSNGGQGQHMSNAIRAMGALWNVVDKEGATPGEKRSPGSLLARSPHARQAIAANVDPYG